MSADAVRAGLAHADRTKVVEVGSGVLGHVGDVVVRALDRHRPFVVVADERTWAVAGERVRHSLEQAGARTGEPVVFPGTPSLYAAYEHSVTIREELIRQDALAVAVGSGTLNDLVKLASGELDRPYAVVGTAASMDGYTGFGAPMTRDGVKQTLPCPAPTVVVFDLAVAAAAPPAMTASGYGDLAAKIPGGADWILSDAVGIDPIQPLAWDLVQGGVRGALAAPERLAAGDSAAYEGLVNGLILSGLSMQVYGGTRPASGAEHYFSHLWELDHVGADAEPPLSHGFKVAVGTVAMCAFYRRFLTRDLADLDVEAAVASWPSWEAVEADIRARMPGELADHCVRETRAKYLAGPALGRRLRSVVARWPELSRRVAEQVVGPGELQRRLRAAGAPATPQDIGLDDAALQLTFRRAAYYRARYSVLDLARETGLFEEVLAEVFPGGRFNCGGD